MSKVHAVHYKLDSYASKNDQKSLNSTDEKINLKVIGGGVLIALAAAGLAATITCAVIFTPIGLCGLAGVAAAGVAGTYFCWSGSTESKHSETKPEQPASKPKKRRSSHRSRSSGSSYYPTSYEVRTPSPSLSSSSPVSPKERAVGLVNQSGSDCWLNSSMQILLNAPRLLERIQEVSPAIQTLAQSYLGQSYALRGIKQVRNELRSVSEISKSNHEDAADAFNLLLSGERSPHQMTQSSAAKPAPALIGLPFAGTHLGPTFDGLLAEYFHHQNDEGAAMVTQFRQAPDDLLIQVQRFYHQYDHTGSAHAKVTHRDFEVPEQCVLPEGAAVNGEIGTYECRGFNVHTGTLDFGHYVAYVKKGEQWWLCDDSRTSRVSNDRALQAMKTGYIFHYQKMI